MEWKKIKMMLIVLFLAVDLFLGYMVYKEEVMSYNKRVESAQEVLQKRNIIVPDIKKVKAPNKMKRLLIEDENGLKKDLIIKLSELVDTQEYLGKNKEVVDIITVLFNFLRENKAQNIGIEDIYIAYFYDSNKVTEQIKSAEAEPIWVIKVKNDSNYIYRAYDGVFIKKLNN